MALSTIESNNKLIKFTKDINREYVRENMFSPYMGDDLSSIIRLRYEPKSGGEQMNIPLVTRLTGSATGVGTLTGNEEVIDNYGMRVWIDWARHAVVTNKAEKQKDSADTFGEAKPLLSDWGKELQRDEIIEAFMALPSESAPANLGSNAGQRVNGILYGSASGANNDTWLTHNSDRVLYGATTANQTAGNHTTSLSTVATSADDLSSGIVSLAKLVAKSANPKIRPWKTKKGYEFFVMFAGSRGFRDLKISLGAANQAARPREEMWKDNPIFMDGDLLWDGVIIREVPEIDTIAEARWSAAAGAADPLGATAGKWPAFLCGQSALVQAWGQMAIPTTRDETDYGFLKGVGVEMAYGISKTFKKHPMGGSALKQWGVVTVFHSASAT